MNNYCVRKFSIHLAEKQFDLTLIRLQIHKDNSQSIGVPQESKLSMQEQQLNPLVFSTVLHNKPCNCSSILINFQKYYQVKFKYLRKLNNTHARLFICLVQIEMKVSRASYV